MSIWLKVVGWILGLDPGKVLQAVTTYLQARANDALESHKAEVGADTQLALAQITAQVELNKQQAALLLADRGWWVTAWIRPLLLYPFVLHSGAVVISRTFDVWSVPALLPPFDDYEGKILLTYIGVRGLEKIARVFSAARK